MPDLAILLDLCAPTLPFRPEAVIERQVVPPRLEAARRLADRSAASYEAGVSAWIEALGAARERADIAAPKRDMTEEERDAVTHVIEEVEYDAEVRAIRLTRFVKRAARDTRHWFSLDPSLGALTRSLSDRLIASDERVIEALLDHALYLRAFRAERDPEAREGPVFDDPEALGRHLRDAVVA